MGILQTFLTGKIPGFDPPRLVPWSAALALGCLALSGIAPGFIQPARPPPWTRLRRCGESETQMTDDRLQMTAQTLRDRPEVLDLFGGRALMNSSAGISSANCHLSSVTCHLVFPC